MKIKKFFANLICGFIPSKTKRKQLRNELMNSNNFASKTFDKLNNNKFLTISQNGTRLEGKEIPGLKVHFNGKNSIVKIHKPTNFKNCNFSLGDNCYIEIDSTKTTIKNLIISTRFSSQVVIGRDFSCISCNLELHDEANTKILIGEDCQFSYGINIRTSDGHAIYDTNTGEVLNVPKGKIEIGNHVWVGMHTKILKDVHISDNSIIGAGSIVTKSFDEPNVIIAGTPAKIVKHNVNWNRKNTDHFKTTPSKLSN